MARDPSLRNPETLASSDALSVRMYRGILGDCFLLTHTLDGETYRALIDCGVLQRIGKREAKPETERGLERMEHIVENLIRDANGRLDLVVATHEHYDHLSGFMRHWEKFRPKELQIGRVWMAWTENTLDTLARGLTERTRETVDLLKKASKQADESRKKQGFSMSGVDEDRIGSLGNMLQFYGDDEPAEPESSSQPFPPADYISQGTTIRSCKNALEALRQKARSADPADGVSPEERVRFLSPGQVVSFGVKGRLKAYVLGPPRSAKLKKMDPTPVNKDKGESNEVYLTTRGDTAALSATLRFNAAGSLKADAGGKSDVAAAEGFAGELPFAQRFRCLGDPPSAWPTVRLYDRSDQVARRIDWEWMGTAEALAMKIDGDVNNTSLVLAIETPGTERHMFLFAADAQVGSWESWGDQRYPMQTRSPDEPTDSIEDILSRVILYKVGHHGSHNATARSRGLELMTSPHLVAMIPVVSEVAREQASKNNPDGWAMPYEKLDNRLKEKTRQRVITGDGAPARERQEFTGARSLFDVSYQPDTSDPLWVELSYKAIAPAA